MSELAQAIGSQIWLDNIAKPVEKTVEKAFPGETGRTIKDGLQGSGSATRCIPSSRTCRSARG